MSGRAAVASDQQLADAARRLGEQLEADDEQLAVAESCSGGLFGHVVTDVSQASNHFLGGVICYSSAVKERMLGVPHALIEDPGPVSEEVARALLDGVLARFPAATMAVSITGVAGPQSDGDGHPVGLTYIGVTRRGGEPQVRRFVFEHGRDGNKRAAVLEALRLATAE